MLYKVIMIESFHPTHVWQYDDPRSALKQFRRLTLAFAEVNEVSIIMFKFPDSYSHFNETSLIQSLVI